MASYNIYVEFPELCFSSVLLLPFEISTITKDSKNHTNANPEFIKPFNKMIFHFDLIYESQILAGSLEGIIIFIILVMQYEF